jgi:hypothetical protein
MVLQAAIDESAAKDGVFVLAGYIAPAESWARFSDVWGRMLRPFGTPRPDGRYHFKMHEMAARPDGIAKSEPFYRVIEENVLGWVSVRLNQQELRNAIRRINIPGALIEDWASFGNPWYIAFRYLMDQFHFNRSKMDEAYGSEKIDFIFDSGVDKRSVLEIWEGYLNARPDEVRKYYGAVPRFEDDMDFLPLQAADFWAWWVRRWTHEGAPEKIETCDFGAYRPRLMRKTMRVAISVNEDDILTNIARAVRNQIGNRRMVDLKTGKDLP